MTYDLCSLRYLNWILLQCSSLFLCNSCGWLNGKFVYFSFICCCSNISLNTRRRRCRSFSTHFSLPNRAHFTRKMSVETGRWWWRPQKGLIDSCQRLVGLQSSTMIDFYHISSSSDKVGEKSWLCERVAAVRQGEVACVCAVSVKSMSTVVKYKIVCIKSLNWIKFWSYFENFLWNHFVFSSRAHVCTSFEKCRQFPKDKIIYSVIFWGWVFSLRCWRGFSRWFGALKSFKRWQRNVCRGSTHPQIWIKISFQLTTLHISSTQKNKSSLAL